MNLRSRCIVMLQCLILTSLISCSSIPLNLGKIERVPYSYTESEGRHVKSMACGFMLGGFIPIRTWSRAKRAYDEIEREARGGYIEDLEVSESWVYAFVGTKYCMGMSATVYPRRIQSSSRSE